MTSEDDKQRRKKRFQQKKREKERYPAREKWWSPDSEARPRKKRWEDFDENEDDFED